MKKKNRIWICPLMIMGMLLMLTNSCKKDDENTNPTNGWSALGGKQDIFGVSDMYVDKSGNIYAVGSFKNSSGNYYVAKWDGSKWSEVGTLDINDNIEAITGDANGNLYICGLFTNANDHHFVDKWNGVKWINIGEVDGGESLCADANNNVYAGTDTRVFKWNGNNWTALNMTGFVHWVNTLLTDASGNLYVGGGSFVGSGGSVAKWNGNGWSEIGTLNTYEQVYSLCLDANGNLYAGGGFLDQSGYVVKWNGSNWTDLGLNGNGQVRSI